MEPLVNGNVDQNLRFSGGFKLDPTPSRNRPPPPLPPSHFSPPLPAGRFLFLHAWRLEGVDAGQQLGDGRVPAALGTLVLRQQLALPRRRTRDPNSARTSDRDLVGFGGGHFRFPVGGMGAGALEVCLFFFWGGLVSHVATSQRRPSDCFEA